jgi:hypothetical protein
MLLTDPPSRVIAIGIWDKGVLYATLISKRLSHSY